MKSRNQLKAAEILEGIFAEQPNHPGVAHNLIHRYDYPTIAERGLSAARRYASIAPSAPHALHMPSHIFTRRGFWQESINSNRASAAAKLGYWVEQVEIQQQVVRAESILGTVWGGARGRMGGRPGEGPPVLQPAPHSG
jgi:hypothetical protein